MSDYLDDRDFYELMQSYRHSDIADQKGVIEAFEAVKAYIRAALAQPEAEPVAHMWQHPETGMTGFVENAPLNELAHWEHMNKPRKIIAPLYAAPPAQPAPAVPAVRTFSSDPECNYYATEGQVCTECGRIHRDSPVDIAPAAPAVPAVDCRTCAKFAGTHAHGQCLADLRLADLCMDGDRYEPLPPVRLWIKT